jgi:hypothetical protein
MLSFRPFLKERQKSSRAEDLDETTIAMFAMFKYELLLYGNYASR